MNSIELLAPAKVNLFLKILNKRKDGYHNILTLFERISLQDRIRLEKIAEGIQVSSDKPITRHPEDNLAYKAARLILNNERLKAGVKIEIKKRIPMASGLGGGSSDAASVLVGMNKLFNLRLKRKTLLNLAKQLGADVPFFISNTPFAIGVSRGDELKVVNCKMRFWHLVVYPGFGISTKDIYAIFDQTKSVGLTNRVPNVKMCFSSLCRMDLRKNFEPMLRNELEDIVISKKAVIGKIIKRLVTLSDKRAIVSGSGPSVFCLCRTRKEASEVKRRLFIRTPAHERKSWQVFIARTAD